MPEVDFSKFANKEEEPKKSEKVSRQLSKHERTYKPRITTQKLQTEFNQLKKELNQLKKELKPKEEQKALGEAPPVQALQMFSDIAD